MRSGRAKKREEEEEIKNAWGLGREGSAPFFARVRFVNLPFPLSESLD